MIKTSQPALHGDQHLPTGSDPIPGFPDPGGGTDVSGLILATEPVGFWKLDELTGTVAHDSSGNGHDMSPPGGYGPPTWGQTAGPPGLTTALWPTYVSLSTTKEGVTLAGYTNNFTAGIWVYQIDNRGVCTLFGQGAPGRGSGSGSALKGWCLNFSTISAAANVGDGVGGSSAALNSDVALAVATWYFLALVADAGTWKLYVNGILQSDTGTVTGIADTNTWIGTDATTGVTSTAQNTLMSCAFITNSVLHSTELLEIYNSGIYGGSVLPGKVWTALGDGTAEWADPTILVQY